MLSQVTHHSASVPPSMGTLPRNQTAPSAPTVKWAHWPCCVPSYVVHAATSFRSATRSLIVWTESGKRPYPAAEIPASLAAGAKTFIGLQTGLGGAGLDYLRDDLFPIDAMAPIPPDGQGVTLRNQLDGQIKGAKADRGAVLIAFGEFCQDRCSDATFGFAPERGVHDIHMMQDNSGSFADDNRINGDGALFIRFAGGETIALFIRFTTQSTTTDDQGNPK
jgi:hypothetical protein